MDWQVWFTLTIAALVFWGMVKNWFTPDVLLLGGVIMLALGGIVTPKEAFAGFANEGMLTVVALFIVAAALRETGALNIVGSLILGEVRTAPAALRRLALAVPALSAFLNNTPIVAMMLPVVTDWCRKHHVAPSRLLIPLSFFTVLGGMCTVIGTSTNLVVSGLMTQAAASLPNGPVRQSLGPLSLFEIAPLGLACAAVGISYMLLASRTLLPDHKEPSERFDASPREYVVELLVGPGCRLAGHSVEAAGLRHLSGLFLIEIARGSDTFITPVSPDETLQSGDRLRFAGSVTSILELEQIPGLMPVADSTYAAHPAHQHNKRLCEAVISPTSPLLGKSIRDADFRARYNAAVVAVHRGGERLTGRIGDITLRLGDTLLLQTGTHFARAHRNDPDFILVSSVEGVRPLRHDRAQLSLLLLGLLIALLVSGVVDIVLGAFLVAGLMIATRCISGADARESVDWQTVVSIGAAFGMGKGLENSGAAKLIADLVVRTTDVWGPIALLAAIYLVTMILTELLTNNAAAALMFPLVLAIADQADISPRPFVIGVMFAASLAFATPIGYQTNLMIYGPGGYRFADFTRIGLPLNLLLWAIATLLIPLLWPFRLP